MPSLPTSNLSCRKAVTAVTEGTEVYRGINHYADAYAWELGISGDQLLPDRLRRRVSTVANTELSLDFL